MKSNSIIGLLAVACVLSGSVGPGWAEDAQTNATPSPSVKSQVASFPKKALGLLVGAFVGMPIAAVRKSREEEMDAIHYMCGNTDKKVILVPVATFWLPLAIATGVMEAPVYGAMDSLKNFDKPFSKEQFSLGDMK